MDITGDNATVDTKGGMTVNDPDSIGIQIASDTAAVNTDDQRDIRTRGTGTNVKRD